MTNTPYLSPPGLLSDAAHSSSLTYLEVKIEGIGTYYVPKSLGESFARLIESAREMSTLVAREADFVVPVHLVGAGSSVIGAIKFVRILTKTTLKDAEKLVDRARGANGYKKERVLLGRCRWADALRIKSEGAEEGAVIEIPSPLEMLARASK